MTVANLLKLSLFGALALAATQATAAPQNILCSVLEVSNNGKVRGLRVFKNDDGSLLATLDEVTMFHRTVVNFREKPLQTFAVQEIFNHFGPIYRGEGIQISIIRDLTEPNQAMGQVTLGTGANQTTGPVIQAYDINSGYCN